MGGKNIKNKTNLNLCLNDEEEDYKCIVCFEKKNIIKNPYCDCNYYFHEICYANWLLHNESKCMICKKDLSNLISLNEEEIIIGTLSSPESVENFEYDYKNVTIVPNLRNNYVFNVEEETIVNNPNNHTQTEIYIRNNYNNNNFNLKKLFRKLNEKSSDECKISCLILIVLIFVISFVSFLNSYKQNY